MTSTEAKKKTPTWANGFEAYCAKIDRRSFAMWYATTNRVPQQR